MAAETEIIPTDDCKRVKPSERFYFDFDNAEIVDVVRAVSEATCKGFIFDDSLRGRISVVMPERVDSDQLYPVFLSILKQLHFTTVEAAGGLKRIVPIRDVERSDEYPQ